MNAILRHQLIASEAATRPEAQAKLESEVRQTLWRLDETADDIAGSHPIHARRLRDRAKHLRLALQALGAQS